MIDSLIDLIIPGQPVPKGRPRVVHGHTYTPVQTVKAERAIAKIARDYLGEDFRPITGPVFVSIEFFCDKETRSDIDNRAKLILDALNGIAYADDHQVRKLNLEVVRFRDKNPRSLVYIGRYEGED